MESVVVGFEAAHFREEKSAGRVGCHRKSMQNNLLSGSWYFLKRKKRTHK